ncbi:MAG TPA: COX15/CtaA family protein [Bryobacteraceae bacterium]|nr:COX15/CtaA family protein [Bryobacteraceae bacterium]
MDNSRLHRFTVVVAVCTFLLVVAGSLVTSNDAALSVPDWPLSYGRLVPPLEGGIRYEFAHRVMAALVAVLTIVLAVWLERAEPRRWMRRLGWAAVGAVLLQAGLGGAAVRLVTPKTLTIAHACLAEICFGLVVAVVAGQTMQLAEIPRISDPAPLMAAVALFGQAILGAMVRYGAAGVGFHIIGAAIATILVMWAGLRIPLRRPALALLTLTFSQVFLGLGAYMARVVNVTMPQPMPLTVAFTSAHVAVGSLAFGAAIVLTMAPAVAHGGVALA